MEPLGTVRRSQLVSTYSIGAIIDLEKGSFMPMGLEDWEGATRQFSLTISEARLQAQLGVTHFRLPPVAAAIPGTRLVEEKPTVPAVRFPLWHECPKCHRIGTEGSPFELAADGSRLNCTACGKSVNTNPVRFVVACRKGHIDEFPWEWWAHRNHKAGICKRPGLYLQSMGKSAALADLSVVCKACGAPPVSLGDAFSPGSVNSVCGGSRPWLYDRQSGCDAMPRVIQRGASNAYFPVVASALSIPPVSDAAFQIIEENWLTLGAVAAEAVTPVLESIAAHFDVACEILTAAYREKIKLDGGADQYTDSGSRAEEYAALSSDRHDQPLGGHVPQFQNTVLDPPAALAGWFDVIGAVSRLREVRALAGFSRIEPYPVSAERIAHEVTEGNIAPLSKTPRSWLPAAEIRGEGIFLRFRAEAIARWLKDNPAIKARVAALESRSAAIAAERGYTRDYTITAPLLLVHSFAHALIRQISIDCGYSSSALRERLYVAEPKGDHAAMNGLLVYTGSPDSEGSLGGLVRLADPAQLERIVQQTIRSSQWCGSDPVCLEGDPRQSGDRISGAACHCCLLVPETSCEKFNRELDRTMLVGDADGRWQGYFGTREQD
ncbi:DUF1998 domain-containing protein [Massilia sp. R2A-15]|uniref:DUF1998 domain-containing protein n=1 Tax=Massilia sp. R2A-15 TaxID=3064278 RepID=UPI00273670AF|nr:DUF1998 domain-containing protein [Massilia sp. R2A-15]WLI87842.1 DUF1998 domain-containing protein [Massilia sp. R2A-15]